MFSPIKILEEGNAIRFHNLFGKGKEPFWQQAYTNLVKFIILLHKVLDDYVTLFDVYECAINPQLLEQRIEGGRRRFEENRYVLVDMATYLDRGALAPFPFEADPTSNRMKVLLSEDLFQCVERHQIPYEIQTEQGSVEVTCPSRHSEKRAQFEAVERHDRQELHRRSRLRL